ncbi:MAG: PD-(D/E)XK nuclease domain-containing protein [Deltaproteobacteria bacterium]|nr:PD-(D/E)XK nuclease domain-containing protein [Deltaproteobacteria bacterium]
MLRNILVSISYHQHPTAKRDEQWDVPGERHESEKFYHGILHGSLLSAGFDILSEVSGADGRADIVWSLHNGVRVVIELKYSYPDKNAYKAYEDTETDLEQAKSKAKEKEKELTAALDRAEAQLRSKDYAGPHRAARHKVIYLAIAILGRTDIVARFVDLEDARDPAGS